MRLIVRCDSPNEHGDNPPFVFVDLTPSSAAAYLGARGELVRVMANKGVGHLRFFGAEFWDHTVGPYVGFEDDGLNDWGSLDATGWVEAPAGYVQSEDDHPDWRMDVPTVQVMEDGIQWVLGVKHGTAGIETATLPWELIEKIAGVPGGKRR